jgi:hypothetical protein
MYGIVAPLLGDLFTYIDAYLKQARFKPFHTYEKQPPDRYDISLLISRDYLPLTLDVCVPTFISVTSTSAYQSVLIKKSNVEKEV